MEALQSAPGCGAHGLLLLGLLLGAPPPLGRARLRLRATARSARMAARLTVGSTATFSAARDGSSRSGRGGAPLGSRLDQFVARMAAVLARARQAARRGLLITRAIRHQRALGQGHRSRRTLQQRCCRCWSMGAAARRIGRDARVGSCRLFARRRLAGAGPLSLLQMVDFHREHLALSLELHVVAPAGRIPVLRSGSGWSV
eukprot:scaffold6894_cov104-Isochrysis_galbana.AAC.1